MDEKAIERLKEFHHWISRHLVSLGLVYHHVDESGKIVGGPFFTACSGFIMSFGDAWYLITAGHVLSGKDGLDALCASPRVRIDETFLIDFFGKEAKHKDTIPFDYKESVHFGEDKDGLDWGFILLNPNVRKLLEANGVIAVKEVNWMLQHQVKNFFAYLMLGIPSESVKPGPELGRGSAVIGQAANALLAIKKLDDIPEGVEATKNKRFIGEITNLGDIDSIEGMSGGPIFGLAQVSGKIYYWVIAVQSRWYKKKFIFGTPVQLFGRMLVEALLAYSPPEVTGEAGEE